MSGVEQISAGEQVVATKDAVVRDDALGFDRHVRAGQPVPPELVAAYQKSGNDTKPSAEQHPAGTVIAEKDTIVHDETIGIDRRLFAGKPVPPDLVEAYKAQTSDDAADSGDMYAELDKATLEAKAEERELTVEGTGSGGNVLVEDLRRALREDDAS